MKVTYRKEWSGGGGWVENWKKGVKEEEGGAEGIWKKGKRGERQ